MATQRYETVFKDTTLYFSSNCPVVLSAYAVLFDTKEQKYGAQLKLKNCSEEVIKTVSVNIRTYDRFDKISEEIRDFQYVDVKAGCGADFGNKTLIDLSEHVPVNKLEVAINSIFYESGKSCIFKEEELLNNKLDLQKLSSVLSDEDIENYRFLINNKMKYVPQQKGALWTCSCGTTNYDVEKCHVCEADRTKVLDYIDVDCLHNARIESKYEQGITLRKQQSVDSLKIAIALFEEINGYKDSGELADACREELKIAERALAEKKLEEEKRTEIRRVEEEEKAKKNKKIMILVAAAAIVCLAGILIVKNVVIPSSNYNKAVKLMESGDYEEAYAIFSELNDYRDSEDRAAEAQKGVWYEAGLACLERQEYEDAVGYFYKARPFKDSEEKWNEVRAIRAELDKETKYEAVLDALKQQQYKGLKKELEELGDYKESEKILNELNQYEEAMAALNSKEAYLGIESFAPAMELIKNGKYVKFPEETLEFVNFFGPFLGKWEYSDGDVKILSYTGSNSEKWKDIPNIEIKFTRSYNGTKETIQLYKEDSTNGMYASLPTANMEEGTITQNNYKGGKFVFSIQDDNTLLVDFYGKDSMPEHLSAQYTKVE